MKSKSHKKEIALASAAALTLATGIGIKSVINSKKKSIVDYETEPRKLQYFSIISEITNITSSIFNNGIPLSIIKEKVINNGNFNKQIKCGDKIKIVNDPTELNIYIKGTCGFETAYIDVKIGLISKDHKGWCEYADKIYKENLSLFTDSINKNKKIYIIGASLGAAVTAYLISFLLDLYDKLGKEKRLMGICIASPRCVNKIRNEKIYNYIYSIVNMLDIVTYTPPNTSLVISGRIIAIKEEENDISFILYNTFDEYLQLSKEYLKRTKLIPKAIPYHFVSYYGTRIKLLG